MRSILLLLILLNIAFIAQATNVTDLRRIAITPSFDSPSKIGSQANSAQQYDQAENATDGDGLVKKTKDFLSRLVIVVLLLAIGIGLFLGLTDRAIFYRDGADLIFCFTPLGGAFIIYLVFGYLFEAKGEWVNILGGVTALVLGMFVLYRSCELNSMNIFVGGTVGIAKIALGLFALLQLFQIVSPSGKTQGQKRTSQAMAFILFTLVSALIYRLVNGERVLARQQELVEGNSTAHGIS